MLTYIAGVASGLVLRCLCGVQESEHGSTSSLVRNPRRGRSEEASSVIYRSVRERLWRTVSGFQIGEDGTFLAAGGQPAGTLSVLLTVDPLKQDIQQEVTSKNAKPHEHCKRHADSSTPMRLPHADERIVDENRLESPQRIMRNSLGLFSGKCLGAKGHAK